MATQRAERVPRGRAALNGVLATGAGMGAGHFVSLLAPASSPVVAVASRAIDLTPGPVKDWAVSTFGTADKAVLVVGAIAVTLGLGALVGLVARRSTLAGLICSAALAAIAIAAAGPNSGRELLWWAPGLGALGVGGWALLRLLRSSEMPTPSPSWTALAGGSGCGWPSAWAVSESWAPSSGSCRAGRAQLSR